MYYLPLLFQKGKIVHQKWQKFINVNEKNIFSLVYFILFIQLKYKVQTH